MMSIPTTLDRSGPRRLARPAGNGPESSQAWVARDTPVRGGTREGRARWGGVDPVDDGPVGAGVVLVFGPVAALEQVVGRLIECGALADADTIVSDADNPARRSCVLHIAEPGGVQGTGTAGQRRAASAGILESVAALWRGNGHDAARPTGRHRARTGG
ncbi:hypothetical protein ACU686_12095 [Yinghuangia aomiensis]